MKLAAEQASRGNPLALINRELDRRTMLLGCALALIAIQTVFRGWVIRGGWFYHDDLPLLVQAPEGRLTADYAFAAASGHLSPGSRGLVWLTRQTGLTNWDAAVSVTLVLQLAASLACLHMLVVLFGRRWAILAPLSLYLFTVLGLPGVTWWAASLLTTALSVALFESVAFAVLYLRAPSWRGALPPVLWVGFGLIFYEKAALLLVVLAFLAIAYFSSGTLWRRLCDVIRRYRHAVVVTLGLGSGYAALYLWRVPPPLSGAEPGGIVALTDNLVGKSLLTGALGGPLTWEPLLLPMPEAAPPEWLVRVAWVITAFVVAAGFLTRVRTGRSWGLLVGYLAATVALMAMGRANALGPELGLQYRYLTDVAGVLILVIALVFLELRGAPNGSEYRPVPLLHVPRLSVIATGAVLLASVGGFVSSVSYAQMWHKNPARDYIGTARTEIEASGGTTDLVDHEVPVNVIHPLIAPFHMTRQLIGPLTDLARFPDQTAQLHMLDDEGHVRRVTIDPIVESLPGPVDGCGWPTEDLEVVVPLGAKVFDLDWWMRIGYLASEDGISVVRHGGESAQVTIRKGLNDVYVRVRGGFDEVRLQHLRPTMNVCVGDIQVGTPEPGALP